MKRRILGSGAAALLALGLAGVSAAGAQTVHGHYVDKQGLVYTISKAMTLPHGTRFTHPPKGAIVVIFYVTETNTGKRYAYYGAGALDASASKTGKGFPTFDPAPDYPWINGGELSPRAGTNGWFGYVVPSSAKTIYLRFTGVIGKPKVLLTYHPRP